MGSAVEYLYGPGRDPHLKVTNSSFTRQEPLIKNGSHVTYDTTECAAEATDLPNLLSKLIIRFRA